MIDVTIAAGFIGLHLADRWAASGADLARRFCPVERHLVMPAGPVFAATPFLQWYHGYPNHFQNFTLTGHERLFSRAGFTLVSSGTSVGPTAALLMLAGSYTGTYFSTGVLRRVAGWASAIIGVCVRPLDKWINRNPRSHSLASATFVHATKP